MNTSNFKYYGLICISRVVCLVGCFWNLDMLGQNIARNTCVSECMFNVRLLFYLHFVINFCLFKRGSQQCTREYQCVSLGRQRCQSGSVIDEQPYDCLLLMFEYLGSLFCGPASSILYEMLACTRNWRWDHLWFLSTYNQCLLHF